MLGKTQANADWRALTCAVLIGSGIGLGLGASYLAGGMARAATDHARSSRLAAAATDGFTESVLEREAAAMDPATLRLARAHDPLPQPSSVEGDRRAAVLAARLERDAPVDRPLADPNLLLRTAFGGSFVTAPRQASGALEGARELDCLTQAVYFEARGESAAGQAAVAQVVMNRVRNPNFPKSVCGVVFQGAARGVGCQFSFACDGSTRRRRDQAAWDRAQQIASRALTGATRGTIGGATHFHTVNVQPDWGPNLLRVAQVGLHVFYRFGHGSAAPSAAYPADGKTETAVLTSLAAPAAGELRLASAVLSQTPAAAPAVASGPQGAARAPSTTNQAQDAKAVVSTTASKPAEVLKLTPASQSHAEPTKVASITAS